MRVKIDVTASDIRLGQLGTSAKLRSESCPVFRGAARKIRGVTGVGKCIVVTKKGEASVSIELPEKAKNFITMADMAFTDDEITIKPFSFTVNVPKEFVK